jgi:hypothetical protein
MSQVRDENFSGRRASERGGSRLNFLITVAVIAAIGYAGYQYVPVAYQASQLKIFMQDTVNSAAITEKKPQWVEDQLRKSLTDYGAPPKHAYHSCQSRVAPGSARAIQHPRPAHHHYLRVQI